ncbi:3-dehydroquinate synthase [Sphaerisporangium rufum]|uniref:3-dehydroquinate synthase n=1 Tax=Sphaerisporangium rufum TaxID=1381558 RepID=A0A919V0G1_9ACTN|nr:3-dehydroquinate synthase [Sphaerisporangium rufum]GII78734.1 3-dehydroquinate synthase [Sphaerisporangium rufum]
MSVTRITVGGERPYDVVVGAGVLGELPGLVGPRAGTVAVIHPETLPEIARPACGALEAAGYAVLPLPVPDGERAKTAEVAAGLWSALGRHGMTRSDAVVGVGGGATTDLAGFVAATWLRGVTVVQVPTTLLGMVDAAVGGKTGINTPEGKNLVGSFHPPAGVLCDLATLVTVPRDDYVAGLAEVIKGGFIADPEILRLVEADPEGAREPGGPHTRELVERKIRVKAEVVGADLRESGVREILNYGHTLAHAIERAEDYRMRHGEAVAIGMVYAAELSELSGHAAAGLAARTREILASVGLPTAYRREAWAELRDHMRVDKKNRGAVRRFVVLDGVAAVARLEDPPEELLEAAFRRIAR